MDKQALLSLLSKSIFFTDVEKDRIEKNFDKLPEEFIAELEKMLIRERDGIDKIEDDFLKDANKAMNSLKDDFLEATGGDNAKAEEVMEVVKEEFLKTTLNTDREDLLKESEE